MSDPVRLHYELYPYPGYPLLASLRRCDGYALNLSALWARFNGELPPPEARRILVAGCGSFAPYPFSLANPEAAITALDLSGRSLGRARLHCLLHGRRNVAFRQGDLLDPQAVAGRFGLIDAYGVLHHLDDPLAGLQALAARLCDGGILRVMLYSRYARREEESIRRAFRLLGVHDPAGARRLIRRSKAGSRLRGFAAASDEAAFAAGLADALLHPRVHTFRIDALMEMVRESGLEPLLFAHNGALEDVGLEVARIRGLEAAKGSPGNFVLYLGRNTAGPCPQDAASSLLLNPCLSGAVGPLRLGTLHIPPRLGHANPPLGYGERRFLRRFTTPVRRSALAPDSRAAVAVYTRALFLLQYRG
ncbi:MAG: class I SAM-dependent methyltransferase [Deltaproteobacteria bacterium]|nr:class I SAM-dependent methyltransferase [Deltaproteobacteria bacterium]